MEEKRVQSIRQVPARIHYAAELLEVANYTLIEWEYGFCLLGDDDEDGDGDGDEEELGQ